MNAFIFLPLLVCAWSTRAQTLTIKSLTQDDFDPIARELAVAGLFSSVAGAAPLGPMFGFEIGVVGGLTNTPAIHRVARRSDPGASLRQIPSGVITGAVSVPFGLTVEAGVLPRAGARDFRAENLGLALKWTPTELFFAVPLDLAVRGQLAKSSLKMKATLDVGPTEMNFDGDTTVVELVASKSFGILTPFVGVGHARARAELTGSTSALFDPAFSVSQSESTRTSGALYRAGLEVHLLVLSLGVEYERALGIDRFNAKLAAGF